MIIPTNILRFFYTLCVYSYLLALAESPSTLLQQAIFVEETEGDLETAAQLYQAILNEGKTNRPIIAQATYRLALCRLKTNKKAEAVTLFNQLIEQYSENKELRVQAEQQLRSLGFLAEKRMTELIWDNVPGAPVYPGALSPDEKFFVFLDWNSGNLSIRNLNSNVSKMLTDDATWKGETKWANNPKFSHDGQRIAFTWYQGNKGLIQIIDITGKNRRTIFPNNDDSEGMDFEIGGWTHDQTGIYVQIEEGTEKRISIINISNGKERVITKHESWGAPIKMSPDGKWLAFSEAGSTNKDIYLTNIESGQTFPIVNHPANDTLVEWSGSSALLYTSNRTGEYDLWSLTIDSSGDQLDTEKVYSNIGNISSIGGSDDNDLYYTLHSRPSDVFVAEMNWETGKVSVPPSLLLETNLGRSSGTSVSPSGNKLMYSVSGSPSSICVVDLTTLQSSCFGMNRADWRPFSSQSWSPDENSMIAFDVSPDGLKSGLFLINLTTGQVDDFSLNDEDFRLSKVSQFAEDSKTVFYIRNSTQDPTSQVRAKNIHTGTDTLVATLPGGQNAWSKFQFTAKDPTLFYSAKNESDSGDNLFMLSLASLEKHQLIQSEVDAKYLVSPDKQWILKLHKGGRSGEMIDIFKIMENEAVKVSSTRAPEGRNAYGDGISRGWASSMEYFIFVNTNPDTKTEEAISLNLATGNQTKTGISMRDMFPPHSAPNTNKIYYWGYVEKRTQLWRMQGLPVSKVD